MKRIKACIALITMFGLLLGTAGVASAKTISPVHHAKVSQITAKTTHHQAKSVHKTAKSLAKHTIKRITKHA